MHTIILRFSKLFSCFKKTTTNQPETSNLCCLLALGILAKMLFFNRQRSIKDRDLKAQLVSTLTGPPVDGLSRKPCLDWVFVFIPHLLAWEIWGRLHCTPSAHAVLGSGCMARELPRKNWASTLFSKVYWMLQACCNVTSCGQRVLSNFKRCFCLFSKRHSQNTNKKITRMPSPPFCS